MRPAGRSVGGTNPRPHNPRVPGTNGADGACSAPFPQHFVQNWAKNTISH